MKTPISAIIIVIFSTICFACAQLFYKLGSAKLSLNFIALLTNYPLYIGVFLYGISGILLIIALKKGELSVIHPFYGLSFVWVLLLSSIVLHESITINNIIGVCSIIAGVIFIGGTK